MEYLKIDNYIGNIISEEKFVINNLIPIGFREIEKNKFIFLFSAMQDFDDKSIYLQLLFSASNQFEYDALKKHPNYIPNYRSDNDLKDMYTKLISAMTKDNLFITDLYIWHEKSLPFYYNSTAIRAINNTEAEKLNLYLPRNTFIKVKCLLNNYNIRSSLFPTAIMNKLNINEIKFANVEKVKNIGSIEIEDDYIDTHYLIRADNKVYHVNYRTKRKIHSFLLNKLDEKTFSKYKDNYYIEYIFPFEDKVYLVYPEENNNKIILVFNKDQVEQTNFLNQYNTIF